MITVISQPFIESSARRRRRRRKAKERQREREREEKGDVAHYPHQKGRQGYLALPKLSPCTSPIRSFGFAQSTLHERMSDTVELRTLPMTAPSPKQQPASKLANRYLSTAAQYLTRTRSFHVPSNKQNNGTTPLSIIQHDELVRSIPSDMQTNTPAKEAPPFPSDGPTNSPEENRPQGIVNTLRRSLRKSKERFYNKRAATMKSCHSLHNYEYNATDPTPSVAMTPTLLCRQQYLSRLSTPKTRTSTGKDKDLRKKKLFVLRRRSSFVISARAAGCLPLVDDLFSSLCPIHIDRL